MKMKKRVVAAIVTAVLLVAGAALEVDLSQLGDALTGVACGFVECVQ